MRSKRRLRGDRGAAAVEFALLLPLLMLLVSGIIDFGRAMNTQAVLNASVAEGARAEAVAPGTGTAAATAALPANMTTGATKAVVAVTACTSGTVVSTVTYAFSFLTPVGYFMHKFGNSSSPTGLALQSRSTYRCA